MKELVALLLPAEHRLLFLQGLKEALSVEQFETVRAVFEGAAELLGIVEQSRLSLSRLKDRIFGPKTESGRNLCGSPTGPGWAWITMAWTRPIHLR